MALRVGVVAQHHAAAAGGCSARWSAQDARMMLHTPTTTYEHAQARTSTRDPSVRFDAR
jgi:hypothetical protein